MKDLDTQDEIVNVIVNEQEQVGVDIFEQVFVTVLPQPIQRITVLQGIPGPKGDSGSDSGGRNALITRNGDGTISLITKQSGDIISFDYNNSTLTSIQKAGKTIVLLRDGFGNLSGWEVE